MRAVFVPYWEDNPYHSLLEDRLSTCGVDVEAAGGPYFLRKVVASPAETVLHVHTLHQSFLSDSCVKAAIRLLIFVSQLVLARMLGTRIVWTVHDLSNHENLYPRLDWLANWCVGRIAHNLIVHCCSARTLVAEYLDISPGKIHVTQHANFIGVYPDSVTRTEAREALGIDDGKRLYLFLGLIRPYKGVAELIDAFDEADVDGAELIVAGSVYDKWKDVSHLENDIRMRTTQARSVRFAPGFVPDEKMQLYLRAADVFVVPYREALTSGALILAMSYGLACVAPRIGCMEEMVEDGGELFDPDKPKSLRHALQRAADLDYREVGNRNRRRMEKYTWEKMADKTYNIYRGDFV